MPKVSFGGNKEQKICFQLHLYWTCTLVLWGRILLAQSTTQVKLRAQKIGRDEVNCPPLDKILLYWLTFWKIFGGNLSGNIFFFVFKFLNSFLVSSTVAGLTLYCFIGENLFCDTIMRVIFILFDHFMYNCVLLWLLTFPALSELFSAEFNNCSILD